MADEVIRRDVVELSFDVKSDPLDKVNKELDKIKTVLTKAFGKDPFEELEDGAEDASKKVDKIGESLKKIKTSPIQKLKDHLNDTDTKAGKAYAALKKMGSVSFDKLKSGLKNVGSALGGLTSKVTKFTAVGIGAAATGIGAMVKQSVTAFGELEQLEGGVKKIFDEANTTQIMKDANGAYKDLGLSASEYLSAVNNVGATFAQTMGDQKGYDTARKGMLAVSDYASGTGKNINLLNEKYQMITRSAGSYQSIADQFSGLLPQTSADFLKQAKASGLLTKSYSKLTDVPVAEYQQAVTSMLEIGVKNMGLTSNTLSEAEGTFTGSLGMFKSAWGNLLPAFIQGGDVLDEAMQNVVDSASSFGTQLIPKIGTALGGITQFIEKIAPQIEKAIPKLVKDLLPPLITAATVLFAGVIKSLPSILGALIKEIPNVIKILCDAVTDTFGSQFPVLKKIGDFFKEHAQGIGNSLKTIIPSVLGVVVAFKAFKGISFITSLFGKGKGGEKGGIFSGLTNSISELGKTKTGLIAKGMANLAIIVGGFTILTAACMGILTLTSKFTDAGTMLKMVGIMGALGTVGAALTKATGVLGKIPVMTTLKGIANIGLVVGGMSALYLLVGAVSLVKFDLGRITQITKILGTLGLTGAAMAGFAGLVGMIPIPVVLQGLANIGLVIGGMSALVLAFGKLSEIKGFNEFISKGGDTLANLFGQIGKIGGSLVGGLAEGITNALPKIGGNLAGFAKSIKPLFTMFKGVDVGGVGSFFSAIGGFMLKMTGSKVLEFFAGSPNFKGLANGLKSLATEGVKKFFNMVGEIKAEAFTNGKKFFKVIDEVSSLPNSGGLAQVFSGKNDFSGVAKGLKSLATEGVKKFFVMVQGFEDNAFTKAKNFFKALDGISSLPNAGGLAQLFSGKNDFSGVSSGLKSLATDGVKNFFTMVAGLKGFGNAKKLWSVIRDAGTIVNVNLTGLANKGTALASFMKEVNGAFNKDIGKVVDTSISHIVKSIAQLPHKMATAVKSNGGVLSSAFVKIWKDTVNAVKSPVNKLISGANWVLSQFGSKKQIATWTPYAKGTDGHKGGNALVNDGRGAEMVQMPNGRSFIPQGKNVFIPNAPKGMKVLPAEQTAQLMGRKAPTYKYAKGTGDIDIWSYMDNASGLISAIKDKYVNYDGIKGMALNIGKGMVNTVSGEMTAWAKKLYEQFGALSLANYIPGKGVEQWRTTVIRALQMLGLYTEENVKRTLYQMKTESGGNPYAINLWDSNAKKGIPSKGLMQVIDPTFKAYAHPSFNKNIYDPLSNILASMRYAVARYGSLARAYRGVGYANGGFANSPSIFGEDGLEVAIPLTRDKRSRAISLWRRTGQMLGYTPENSVSGRGSSGNTENNTYAPVLNFTVTGDAESYATMRKLKKVVKEAVNDVFKGMERKTPRLQAN